VVAGIEAKGGKAIAIQADFGIVADVRRLFRDTIARFGHVDIVVNNAWAIARGVPKAFAEITDDEFDAIFTHNARGSFFVMQEAARTISDRGRIINITTAGTSICPPGFSIYVGGKCAMEAFSATLAAELAPRGRYCQHRVFWCG
jgi:3-oxoacyl-[acyl-carrier protein] reductase